MGVPGFFAWLKNKYKKDNFILKKQQVNNVDYLLFDANGLVHPVCREIVINNPDINNERLETKMYIAIIEYMEKLIDLVDPKVAIYVAIDGVAPCAKQKQQRQRARHLRMIVKNNYSMTDSERLEQIENKLNKIELTSKIHLAVIIISFLGVITLGSLIRDLKKITHLK